MAKLAWITEAALQTYLEGLGVTVIPAGISLQDEIDAATGMLHKTLGYVFLAGDSASYDYDPPRSHRLDLGGPFFTITVVKIGKSNDDAGTSLTEGQDYWRKPAVPYTSIEFASRQYGDPESIEITGKKGATDDIPVDLWNAHRDYAAARVYRMAVATGLVSAGPVSRVKMGQMDVEIGNGAKTDPLDVTMEKDAISVFKSYRRRACVGLSQ